MSKSSETPNSSSQPVTFFAPAERANDEQVHESVQHVNDSAVWKAAMEAFGGWVAVLNECRQVLAINDSFLRSIGIQDPARLLGLRLGEVLSCAHAHDHPGGCGTSKFCATCGAAIAMVAAQQTETVQEAECILTFQERGARTDRDFLVRCWPFRLEGEVLLLLTMRDISAEKRRMALERIFLHDISNTATAMSIATGALPPPENDAALSLWTQLRQSMDVLMEEVRIQRILVQDSHSGTRVKWEPVTPSEVLRRIEALFGSQPPYEEAVLLVDYPQQDSPFETDIGLLTRVLGNMVVNALEANREGGQARIEVAQDTQHVEFHVWNSQHIPEKVAMRIFQKYFSTKPGRGRGLGTFGMKLLGENFLKGAVSFSTSEKEGTTFRIRLPRHPT